jgi:hypothetical protein
MNRVSSPADQNLPSSKRARSRPVIDDNDEDYHSPSSKRHKTFQRCIPSTINAAIRYSCVDSDGVQTKLRELAFLFSNNRIPRVKVEFVKASFAIDSQTNSLFLLVQLRRSVPETKWNKIMERTGGIDLIMKPPDPWCNFYMFLHDRMAFSSVEQMTDNEDVFNVSFFVVYYFPVYSCVFFSLTCPSPFVPEHSACGTIR